jgi:hypothetical protein
MRIMSVWRHVQIYALGCEPYSIACVTQVTSTDSLQLFIWDDGELHVKAPRLDQHELMESRD